MSEINLDDDDDDDEYYILFKSTILLLTDLRDILMKLKKQHNHFQPA